MTDRDAGAARPSWVSSLEFPQRGATSTAGNRQGWPSSLTTGLGGSGRAAKPRQHRLSPPQTSGSTVAGFDEEDPATPALRSGDSEDPDRVARRAGGTAARVAESRARTAIAAGDDGSGGLPLMRHSPDRASFDALPLSAHSPMPMPRSVSRRRSWRSAATSLRRRSSAESP